MGNSLSLSYFTQFDHLYVPMADGEKTSAFYYDVAKATRAVLVLHGIQSHAGWFTQTCESLQKAGFSVLAPDRRGSGMNMRHRGHAHSAKDIISDINDWVLWLKAKTNIDKVDIVAISISGKGALPYVHQYSEQVRSLALVTPGLCPKVDIRLNQKIVVGASGAKEPFALHDLPNYGPSFLTSDKKKVQYIENDPLILMQVTAGYLVALRQLELKVRRAIPNIYLPVGLFLAGGDQIVDNEKTKKLLSSITNGNEFLYENAEHTLDFDQAVAIYLQDLIHFVSKPSS